MPPAEPFTPAELRAIAALDEEFRWCVDNYVTDEVATRTIEALRAAGLRIAPKNVVLTEPVECPHCRQRFDVAEPLTAEEPRNWGNNAPADPPDLVLYGAPVCRRCGHTPCPCCRNWCDVFGDEDDPCPCRDDMRCDFDPEALAVWFASLPPDFDRPGRTIRVTSDPAP